MFPRWFNVLLLQTFVGEQRYEQLHPPLSLSLFPPFYPVSLDLLGVDIRHIVKGMKEATAELINNKHNKQLKVHL